MKRAFRFLLLSVTVFSSALSLYAQDAYRTNFSAYVAQWTNAANWERFDSVKNNWIPAIQFPTYLDGVITIQAGDSVLLSGADAVLITIDQVRVNKGGVLMFIHNEDGAVILNNGDGEDLIVNGRMHIGTAGSLRGEGKIQVNTGGLFSIRNAGILSSSLYNDGTMLWSADGQIAGIFSRCEIVNNDTCIWIGGKTVMDSAATFINKGTMWITSTANNLVCADNKKLPARITNKGMIFNTGKDHSVDFQVKVENNGTIGGVGTFLFSAGVSSGGIVSPGASPGHLTVGRGMLRSPTINMEIATTGAVAGVNYDQLTLHSLQDLEGGTINISDAAADSINTEYILVDALTVMNKPYPHVTIHAPSNFVTSFKNNKLVLTKKSLYALPVSWGGFRVVANGNNVMLDWAAVVDKTTSQFVIEHSTNAVNYTPVAMIKVQPGNLGEEKYNYTFSGTAVLKTNYFRIKQVMVNGRSGYSIPRAVRFDKGIVVPFETTIDQANNELQLNIQTGNVRVCLNNLDGTALHEFAFQPGQHAVDIESLPTGAYRLAIFVKDVMVETKQIFR